MKNKDNKRPTKKKLLIYYLSMAAVLLVAAAIAVSVVFATGGNKSLTADNAGEQQPDNPDPPIEDTSSKYEFIMPIADTDVSQTQTLWHDGTIDKYYVHRGVDLKADEGTEVLAAVDGVVESVTLNPVTRQHEIVLTHADGVSTVYKLVNSSETLKKGDTVNRGDVIATVAAATGEENEDGTHLHFEVYKNGKLADPDDFLAITEK